MKNRRSFIKNSLGLVAGMAAVKASNGMESVLFSADKLSFKQEPLPYAYDALESVIDARTMQIHHDLHYGAYVKNANDALTQENVVVNNEKELFANITKYSSKLRNNAGGAYNHAFFWRILRAPKPDNKPTGSLAAAIIRDFGSLDKLKEEFAKAATQQFGSGWAWLVVENGKLKVGGTPNQDNPLMKGVALQGRPVIGLDVWEHAYYLKYQNKRPDYVSNWWALVNWDEAQKNFDSK
ncbi:superoxide dismutase [Sphingobacterium sp. LRF_L2]|uniref:superoxide dismutase n=1 Tax=Sphingobacterium sp. LRF_L2 TaxID=3369421 RepID=UPI003F61574E